MKVENCWWRGASGSVLAVLHRAGLHAGGVSARGLLGHRVADALFAVQQRLEELLLLVRRAVGQEGQHGRVVRALGVHGKRAQIALAQLHLDQRIGQRAQAHAAMLDGDEGAPEALSAGLGPQFAQDGLVVAAGDQTLLGRNAFVMHPLAHLFADGLGLRRNLEIDRHGRSLADFSV